jgi:hypothetical protein
MPRRGHPHSTRLRAGIAVFLSISYSSAQCLAKIFNATAMDPGVTWVSLQTLAAKHAKRKATFLGDQGKVTHA